MSGTVSTRKLMSVLLVCTLMMSMFLGVTGSPTPASASVPNPTQSYSFDEGQGASAADAVSGNPHAITGTPSWVAGHSGQALDFDAQTTSVVIDPIDKTTFTMAAWIKPRTYAYNYFIVGQGISGSQPYMFNWWVNNGKMYFLLSDSSGNGYSLWPFSTADNSIPLNEWTHVAVSRTGNEFKMYVNGALAASKTASGTIDLTGNPNPLRIGAQNTSNNQPMGVFDGAIDEFKVFSQALTAAQVLEAMGGGGDGEPQPEPETTYYVDSAGGNDANAGTSANAAWQSLAKVNGTTFQPGDRILFKAGSSWTGQLWPKGSGTSAKPIVIDKYGTGAKPAFHGAGQVQETVKLYNQQYWEINNLEITNTAAQRATRRAVWIEAHDTGVTRHIHLKNLDIRDVSGQTAVQDLESGGIIVRVTGSATPTKFDDVLIQDNTFTDVDATGIFIRSDWRNRATRTDGSGPWLGMTNIVIKGNSLNRTGGDAIIVCETESALIEHNVAAYSYYDSVGYHAAIWAINSDNALFQYNEAHHTQNTLDGMGFDIDELCNGCVMQYNYSHDNAGGFMLLVGQRGGDGQGYDQNGIVRYNVSENDGTALIQAVGRMQNYQIYNNTFYTGEGMNVRFLMAPDGNNLPQGTLSFKNNIIYNLGQNMTYYCGNATCAYDSNTYYGNHDPSEPANDPHKLTTDPMLAAPGTGGTGVATADGYKLLSGSPSLGSGTIVSGNGGKDYWGNNVSASVSPNRGAYGGPGIAAPVTGTPIPNKAITVNGTLDDLGAVPGIDLASQGTVQMTGYGGTGDLSGNVWATWDNDKLYLSARIHDDTQSQTASGTNTWQGDGIQFAVSPGAPGDEQTWYEYGIAKTPSGDQLYRWTGIGKAAGLVTNAQLSISRNESAHDTVYELALPWSELSPIVPADVSFSLSLLVNDNDGAGREGWIEWGGGIGGTKDSALFNPVSLVGAVSRTLTGISINEQLQYSASPVSLTVTGSYSDSTTGPITGAQWTTSNANVATVSNGVVTFVSQTGSVTITAAYQGRQDSVTYTGTTTPGSNLANQAAAIVSSAANGNVGARAFDQSAGTKWESEYSDPQWLIADLGKPHSINRTKLVWDPQAYGKSFKIRVSNDMIQWTDVYSTTSGNGSAVDVSFSPVQGRFVQMYGTKRGGGTPYAVSEFEVYGNEVPYTPPAVAAPLPLLPIPTSQQIAYQKMETIAFAHFNMNTFTDNEWGNGSEDEDLFNPTDFDAMQWATALKDAGFKLLILTAKHHDGFALWPSAYTTHDVASSSWRNGQGDVVREVADACAAVGIKFGLYVSPWDMHESTYGSGQAYNDFFVNQLTELMTNYGEISEIWFDGAKGEGTPQEYDTDRWYSVIRQLQPNIVIWGSPGDARYIGNEAGIGSETNWNKVIPQQPGNPYWSPNHYGEGFPNGTYWQSGEADVPLRPGWFYHSYQDTQLKSLASLVNIYQKSVGRGNNLLLNVSPDRRGKLPDGDIARLMELRDWIDEAYGTNLASGATATASNVRGGSSDYAAGKLIDGSYDSYWATDDGVTTGSFELNFGAAKTFNAVVLQEYIPLGQRISGFNVQIWNNNAWETVATGTTIGYKRILTFADATSTKLRVNINSSQASPVMNFAGVYDIGDSGSGGSSQDQNREQYFAFNEGQGSATTDAVNASSHPIEGSYSWVTGRSGAALEFNGSNTSVVTDSIVKSNFTLSAWIKPYSYGTNRLILGQGQVGSSTNMFNWWIVDGHMEFLMSDELGNGYMLWPLATASNSVPLNQWTHVAVSKSGTQFKLYVNGQLVVTKSSNADIVQVNNQNPLRIGGQNAGISAGEVFHGAIDELRTYPRTLTDQEILALSQVGS
ncbi:LamG-like jellyroll fold domain-containing protein [Cohnella sp. GCM10027633]|uniref:LamG-like jellyroll fold domain-containing protein n=1 Tax=unclassified Cohnella TaxID=2636738 RepID=UPI00364174DE